MSVSFDFEDNYTQAISETQQIDDQSSDEDGDKKKRLLHMKPTQAILCDSDDDEIEEDEENSGAISPVFESNRTRSPSPVFQSQSLLQTKRVRRTLWETNSATRNSKHDTSSEDMFAATQNIESAPSTQSPLARQQLSGDSTKISSPGSFQSVDELAGIANLDTFMNLHQSAKKIKKPKKGGFVEKLDLALKKSASDRVLNEHLPAKLRKANSEKKTAQVLKVTSDWSLVILRCLDYQLDPKTGKREEFDLILDNPNDRQRCKLSEKCDITIIGPWLSFVDETGTNVISNVFKFDVIGQPNPSGNRKMFKETKVLYEENSESNL